MKKENPNPIVHRVESVSRRDDLTDEERDPIDALEIFGRKINPSPKKTKFISLIKTEKYSQKKIMKDLIRNINDPEHPLTLEQLKVTEIRHVEVDDDNNEVLVHFTPTIPHCSMATLIGLSIRTKLLRSLPPRFKVDVLITPGTHSQETAVNKQLNDKERVAAALENGNLLKVINTCVAHTDP